MIEPPESFVQVRSRQYVSLEPGMTSLDDDIVEQADMSESRYVRSSGGAPPAVRRSGRGRHEKGRRKGRRRAPPWVAPTAEPPSSAGWFPTGRPRGTSGGNCRQRSPPAFAWIDAMVPRCSLTRAAQPTSADPNGPARWLPCSGEQESTVRRTPSAMDLSPARASARAFSRRTMM